MSDSEAHYRLVVLGSGKVGKTAIIQQFINSRFIEKYKETVEDLHTREYHINGHSIKVDILDTSGTLQFPAMRRLSISTAHAFVLVYSIIDYASFENVKQIYNQIQEQRSNFGEIPMVVVGNKSDLELQRVVDLDDARVSLAQNNWNCAHLETSAKENFLILDIFQKLLEMAKIPIARELSPVLKRRMSEYGYKSRQRGERRSFRESDKDMPRSRSLIRRSARPKMKTSDPNKNDCVIC